MIGCHGTVLASGPTPSEEIGDVLDLVQTAQAGSPELDARIDCALNGRIFVGMGVGDRYKWRTPGVAFTSGDAKPSARWSRDVMASLHIIPSSHNYSVGRRDGVCWAWIQPNDAWGPSETEYRHNHPLGSGLLVAYTMSLALMSAAMVLTQRLRGQGQQANLTGVAGDAFEAHSTTASLRRRKLDEPAAGKSV